MAPLDIRPGSRQSPIWRSIYWSKDLFFKGLGKGVLNGESTLFWTDLWLGNTRLIECISLPLPSHQLSLSVRAYWEDGIGWRWHLFAEFLPNVTLLLLASVTLEEEEDATDKLVWTL